MEKEPRGSITGTLLGIITFLVGIALLASTFYLAREMFATDPIKLFDVQPGKTLDLSKAGALLMGVIVKVLLLLVMAIIGGLVANRGVHLYADSRHTRHVVINKGEPPAKEKPADRSAEAGDGKRHTG